jgi:hypothetical protein
MSFPDPRYYDDLGTTKTGSSFTVSNSGWAISCPVITIASHGTSGAISDGTTIMNFANVTTGTLMIDLLQRVVYLGGIPVRTILTASSNGWLQIQPNTTTATWTSTLGSMSTTYRNAYV